MEAITRRTVLTAAAANALLSACGGGGGGGGSPAPAAAPPTPASSAPVIANLALDSSGTYHDATISTANVSGSFSVVSSSITVANGVINNASGQNVGQLTVQVSAGAGSTVQFNVTVVVAQLPLGPYTITLTGQNSSGGTSNALTATWSYLPNPWSAVQMPASNLLTRFSRHFAAVTEAGGKLYVLTGNFVNPYSGPVSRLVDVFDPVARSWSQGPDAPRGRAGAQAVTIDNKIYVIGGYDSATTAAIAEVDVFDVVTGQWSAAPPLPMPRYLSAIAVLNRKIYVMGGTQTADAFFPLTLVQPMDRVDIFDIDAGAWIGGTPLPRAVFGASATTANAGIYLSGGYVLNGNTRALSPYISTFNPQTASWLGDAGRNVKDRAYHAIAAISGKLYAIGGNSTSANNVTGPTQFVESALLPASLQSAVNGKLTAPLNQVALSAAAVTIAGKVYVFIGTTVFVLTPELDVL